MKQFEKKYQVWTYGDSAYSFTEFDTLQECVAEPKYGDWYITKRVLLNVTDADEQLPTITSVPIYDSVVPQEAPVADEESAVLDKYLGGPNGTVTLS